jgi:hypothetical protein
MTLTFSIYEHIKEMMGVKGKPDIIDIMEKKRLRSYDQVKRIPEERRNTLMEGVQTAMTTRNLEPGQGGIAFGFRKTASAAIKPDR